MNSKRRVMFAISVFLLIVGSMGALFEVVRKANYNDDFNVSLRSKAEINIDSHDIKRFIAHAGGAIGEDTYTNSLEALNLNYKKGFRLFELDIIKSSDNIYVAAHNWKHWKSMTGYKGKLPPTRLAFKQKRINNKYTPMDIYDINNWFEQHPDAILVTDKVNTPLEFSNIFLDRERLMMELFSMKALREGIQANIKSAMPNWKLMPEMADNKVQTLLDMSVTDIAASRKIIKNNKRFLRELKDHGIRVYVFHVNHKGIDEIYVICNDMDYIYGLYADKYEFQDEVDCSKYKTISGWYEIPLLVANSLEGRNQHLPLP